MNEQKLIKKQLAKNMLYAFIVFAIILIIFDAIIYHQVSTYMYKSIDKELIRAMELYQNKNIVSEVKKVITKVETKDDAVGLLNIKLVKIKLLTVDAPIFTKLFPINIVIIVLS